MQCVDLGGRRIIKKIFFKQKTAYEISLGLVGSEMCIRDRIERMMRLQGSTERYRVAIAKACFVNVLIRIGFMHLTIIESCF